MEMTNAGLPLTIAICFFRKAIPGVEIEAGVENREKIGNREKTKTNLPFSKKNELYVNSSSLIFVFDIVSGDF